MLCSASYRTGYGPNYRMLYLDTGFRAVRNAR